MASLREFVKRTYEAVTPWDEDAQRRAQANLDRANQLVSQGQNFRHGVLAQPQARQEFVQQNQAPRFNPLVASLQSAAQAPRIAIPSFTAGIGRSAVGVGEGLSGLYDLATPGVGTNRFTKGLVDMGGNIDEFVKDNNLNTGAYKAGQLTGEVASFLAPSTAVKALSMSNKASKLLKTSKLASSAVNVGVGTARGQGYIAAREQDVNPKTIATSAAINTALAGTLAAAAPAVSKLADNLHNRTKLDESGAVGKQSPALPPNPPATKTTPVDVPTKPAGEGKTRGFQENLTKALNKPNPTAKAVIEAIPGYRPIGNKATLRRAASDIAKDPNTAYAKIITKPQLTSAQDVATGNILLRRAIESGDTEAAIQVGKKLGVDGTKLGQAVQAYATFKKTTPEGILKYASKQAGNAGKELDTKVAQELIDSAKRVAAMPDSLDKVKATRELLGQADKVGRTWRNTVSEIISTPRALMATADLSAPLRQGAVLGSRYPKEFAKATIESVKYFGRPKAFEQAMYDISQRSSYPLMKQHKLAVSGAEGLIGTEEQFMKNILETDVAKKAVVGHVVNASNRAYTGFLTKLRADVFDKVINDASQAGVKLDSKALGSLTKFINSASGRGSLGQMEKHAGLLSQALFSPRLWKSRLDVLNPAYYAKLDPAARKLALQSTAAFASITSTVLGLAAIAGADVGLDPRSADFAKIKVGNTRYDILGGLQQNIRLGAQLATGQKINSETGEMQTLGPERGWGKPSRLDLAYQFVENKENPVVAYGTKMLRGTDTGGNPINPVTEGVRLVTPLNVQGAYETIKDKGSVSKGLAMNAPSTFGIGVQTYGGRDKQTKEVKETRGAKPGNATQELAKLKENPGEGYSLQQLSDGRYAYNLNGEISTRKSLTEARLEIAKHSFKESGENFKIVGDKVLRRDEDGSVSTKSKTAYDYELGTAQLSQYKKADNLDGWLKTANTQLDRIDKQLKDPSIDPLEQIKLLNQAETLKGQIAKYKGYGGFTKYGKGGKGRKPSTTGFATASKSRIARPTGVKVRKVAGGSFKAPKTKKISVSKIPSNYLSKKLS